MRRVVEFDLTLAQVYQWCRTGFRKGAGAPHKEVNMRVSVQGLLKARVDDITVLKLSELVDCVAWAFMEKFILSIWLPGLSEEMLKFILDLESYIRRGGTHSSSLSAAPPPTNNLRYHAGRREDIRLAVANRLAPLPRPAVEALARRRLLDGVGTRRHRLLRSAETQLAGAASPRYRRLTPLGQHTCGRDEVPAWKLPPGRECRGERPVQRGVDAGCAMRGSGGGDAAGRQRGAFERMDQGSPERGGRWGKVHLQNKGSGRGDTKEVMALDLG
jgi:hypothetical protein